MLLTGKTKRSPVAYYKEASEGAVLKTPTSLQGKHSTTLLIRLCTKEHETDIVLGIFTDTVISLGCVTKDGSQFPIPGDFFRLNCINLP